MTEVWAGLPSAPGYCVSNMGRVRGPRGELSTPKTPRGYFTCSLRINGKKITTTVQRLVLEAFVGPPPTPAHQANHKDGNKANNCPSNLEWVTQQENVDHAWATGLNKRKPKKQRVKGADPTPGQLWTAVQVLGSHGQVLHTLRLFVPPIETPARCDQHMADVDGAALPGLLTATEAGRLIAGWIAKRPSVALQADIRREAVLWAVAHA